MDDSEKSSAPIFRLEEQAKQESSEKQTAGSQMDAVRFSETPVYFRTTW
jgi:hypothetical protein